MEMEARRVIQEPAIIAWAYIKCINGIWIESICTGPYLQLGTPGNGTISRCRRPGPQYGLMGLAAWQALPVGTLLHGR